MSGSSTCTVGLHKTRKPLALFASSFYTLNMPMLFSKPIDMCASYYMLSLKTQYLVRQYVCDDASVCYRYFFLSIRDDRRRSKVWDEGGYLSFIVLYCTNTDFTTKSVGMPMIGSWSSCSTTFASSSTFTVEVKLRLHISASDYKSSLSEITLNTEGYLSEKLHDDETDAMSLKSLPLVHEVLILLCKLKPLPHLTAAWPFLPTLLTFCTPTTLPSSPTL